MPRGLRRVLLIGGAFSFLLALELAPDWPVGPLGWTLLLLVGVPLYVGFAWTVERLAARRATGTISAAAAGAGWGLLGLAWVGALLGLAWLRGR